MANWKSFIENNTVRVINYDTHLHTNEQVHPALSSFAIDDALATSVGESLSPACIRFWIHDKTLVLGIPDARLPYIKDGIKLIKSKGISPMIRNSGGLAVALDKGVLNISLIFPHNQSTSIHSSYDIMVDFIRHVFEYDTTDIKAYEIVGSYCPGDYDLSINGIKFAGISQRRVKNGISVQIYIDVCGNSNFRAELVKQFYDTGLRGESTPYHYPSVDPSVMGSLSELLNKKITINDVINRINELLNKASFKVVRQAFSPEERKTYNKRLEQMIKRNDLV